MNFTEKYLLGQHFSMAERLFSALYKTEFGTALLNFNFSYSLLGLVGSTIGF